MAGLCDSGDTPATDPVLWGNRKGGVFTGADMSKRLITERVRTRGVQRDCVVNALSRACAVLATGSPPRPASQAGRLMTGFSPRSLAGPFQSLRLRAGCGRVASSALKGHSPRMIARAVPELQAGAQVGLNAQALRLPWPAHRGRPLCSRKTTVWPVVMLSICPIWRVSPS